MAILFFIFGTVIGSFLNVVAFRYTEKRNIFSAAHLGGRSHCQHCHQKLSWFELIPVFSFLIQRGKCWVCRKKISWQYPLVELASGFIFLIPLYLYNVLKPESYAIIAGVIWTAIFLIFLLIWAIDFRIYIIPDGLNFLLAILGLILINMKNFYHQFGILSGSFLGSYALLFGLRDSIWFNHFLATFIAALIFGLIILITRGKGMGMGDLKLITALGILFGWPDIIFIIVFSFLIGSLVSLVLLARGKKALKSHIPFGPFIILGSFAVIFFGKIILESYFRFFNL